jgi:hypothetical protein
MHHIKSLTETEWINIFERSASKAYQPTDIADTGHCLMIIFNKLINNNADKYSYRQNNE